MPQVDHLVTSLIIAQYISVELEYTLQRLVRSLRAVGFGNTEMDIGLVQLGDCFCSFVR